MKLNYYQIFLEIARELNQIGITPLLMGSLGLEQVTQVAWEPSDIDIHVSGDARGWEVPDEERIYQFPAINRIMTKLGYDLVDRHEHAYQKESIEVEFGVLDTLEDFAGVRVNDLTEMEVDGVHYLLPSASQFLQIYQASSQDNYRSSQNDAKDLAKIAFLKRYLT